MLKYLDAEISGLKVRIFQHKSPGIKTCFNIRTNIPKIEASKSRYQNIKVQILKHKSLDIKAITYALISGFWMSGY